MKKTFDVIKDKIDELEKLAEEVENAGEKLLRETSVIYNHELDKKSWSELSEDAKKLQRDAIRKYQRWYNTALQLVHEYIPQKEEEFIKKYEDKSSSLGVVDMLQLRDTWWVDVYHPITKQFTDAFEIQRSILLSVPDVADIKELSLRKIITADVASSEIEEAELLHTNGHHRAAGAIAGVALELFLKTLCITHGINYPPKATIDPLAQALYSGGFFDITELKHVQYLASIRNKCSHPSQVTEQEVKSLIDGVKKLI